MNSETTDGASTNPPALLTPSGDPPPQTIPVSAVTAERTGRFPVIMLSACVGLATGLLELVLCACRWSYDPVTRLGDHMVNRHYLWMIPVADVLIFGACGLCLAAAARVWPNAVRRIAAYVLCGLAALELLLILPGLYNLTYALLACGFASLLAPRFDARLRRLRLNSRRILPGLLGVLVALACYSYGRDRWSQHRAMKRLPPAAADAPNVLLVVLDTVRADALGLYGYYRATSPNLERLARRGVLLEWASATAPWTLPSHASMFTGMWPHQLGVSRYRALDAGYPTLAEAFGARGYATAGFVANPVFCHANYGLGRGFVHYEDIPASPLEVLRSGNLTAGLLKYIDLARFKLSELWGDQSLLFRAWAMIPGPVWRTLAERVPRGSTATRSTGCLLSGVRSSRS